MLLRPSAARLPAVRSATNPGPLVYHATALQRRPRGTRACATREARTLESCCGSHRRLGAAGHPHRRPAGPPPCQPRSLPAKAGEQASRGVTGFVVSQDSGAAGGSVSCTSETTFPGRLATAWARLGCCGQGWVHCSLGLSEGGAACCVGADLVLGPTIT